MEKDVRERDRDRLREREREEREREKREGETCFEIQGCRNGTLSFPFHIQNFSIQELPVLPDEIVLQRNFFFYHLNWFRLLLMKMSLHAKLNNFRKPWNKSDGGLL